ncbi:MAG: hypothetical protein V7L20_23060 [Nostoc sp.]
MGQCLAIIVPNDTAHPPPKAKRRSEERTKEQSFRRSGAALCSVAC